MDKTQQAAPPDIADEAYNGPSAKVTALGQGAIDHLIWGLLGLSAGAAVAAIFHKQITKPLNDLRTHFNAKTASTNHFVAGYGKTFRALIGRGRLSEQTYRAIDHLPACDGVDLEHWVNERENGFGMWMINHTIGIFKPFKKSISHALKTKEWLAPTITAGGTLGAIGYIGGWVNAAIYGGEHAHTGRHQFERAQQKVRDQRAVIDALSEKYIDTKQQLEDLKTKTDAQKGKLHVAADTPPMAHETPPILTPPPDAITVREPAPEKPAAPVRGWKDTIADQRAHAPEPMEIV